MSAAPTPRLGGWARADGFVGVVAGVDDGMVTLFDPAERRRHTAPVERMEAVPSAAVRVTATVDLPVPHGVTEHDLRRWIAVLADPVLREHAASALADAGLDAGVVQPTVTLTTTALSDGSARCLCGATLPSAPVAPDAVRTDPGPACPRCGRQPAPPVTPPGV